MAITEDLTIYFDSSTGMAVTAQYTPKEYAHTSSKTTTIKGIYDNEYLEVLDAKTSTPVFVCATSDVSAVKNGDKLTVNSTVYTIRNTQPDGTGVTRLELEKV